MTTARNYVIGLKEADWRHLVEWQTACRQWNFITSLNNYHPQRGDRVIGFFSLAELSLLQRFGVDVWTLMRDGMAMPDAASAWLHRPHLKIAQVILAGCSDLSLGCFVAGPKALLTAFAFRRGRAGAVMA